MRVGRNVGARHVQRVYLLLTLLSTLATSFIWGINTLFLLDAGLSNTQAFSANAFFALGRVVFEIPTGVVADSWGRRHSYLLGAATLLVTTLLYLWMWHVRAPLVGWALSSALLGLGFTCFSGATEAWLVDALAFFEYDGDLERVFAKGQAVAGTAMLAGSVAGGAIAQLTNLGVPYFARAAMLGLTIVVAYRSMREFGFEPDRGRPVVQRIGSIVRASIDEGLKRPAVRWVMLSAPFSAGVGFFAFYAMQPYLLELYGRPGAYAVAGLAAATTAGARIVAGLLAARIRRCFSRRTHVLMVGVVVGAIVLVLIGSTDRFPVAVGLLVAWAIVLAAVTPVRQAYLNGMIPSRQRATVLSFDALVGSSGAVVVQPSLGRVADLSGYSAAYVVSSAIHLCALPFVILARRHNAASDPIERPARDHA